MPIYSGVLTSSLSSGVFSGNVPDRYSHPGFMRGEAENSCLRNIVPNCQNWQKDGPIPAWEA